MSGAAGEVKSHANRPFQFGLVHVLIFFALIGGALAVIVPAVRFAAEDAAYMRSSSNLHQIALALQNYHDTFHCFPPAYQCDSTGKPVHSWRVLIWNFIESQPYSEQYDFAEPWNGPHNSRLAPHMPGPFHGPGSSGRPPGMTSYVAIIGKGTMWPGEQSMRLVDISDGAAETIMVVEISNSDIHWMEPRDLRVEEVSKPFNPRRKGVRLGARIGGGLVAYADGSVRFLRAEVTEKRLRALLSPTGNDARDAEEP